MSQHLSRRRFLLAAAASGLATGLPAETLRWQGTALGARAQILMDHPGAARLTALARAEITRLERIFSLYDAGSELSRLNRAGVLAAPSFELLDCLSLARHVHRVTEGRFDPTVQPLWAALAEARSAGQALPPARLQRARALVGFDRVTFDSDAVRLGAGQALTLNGIAQGYVADRVAARLKAEGLADVLVDTGEIAARGAPSGQEGWGVSIAHSAERVVLRDRALATSHTYGTVLGADGRQGHILRPFGGMPVARRQVSVSAKGAGLADALSTGLSLVEDRATAQRLVAGEKGVRLEAFLEGPSAA
ncbi:FAD:protein FMN transferase [Pseudoruegeria sp. SHC-113]|uniref:FAD:protein FMN transferase n=1 Tax=Pseudoruegeria sp. SHC-113 TaxID=2855439 RepID=UPI0021BB4E9A|nr:FAD:protein FMN transferase [Pseudoruegeria sp. SHC-113]MCT8159991.1 FAD:protein FMN transferase [Pseudoruegeria sp. SHC-113]